ncbi:PREDICTED: uncharacterized protein LOC108556538 [Nicrophorus vespilloides]|uniref:Uncharacterized protein LOC108556538 n=1 Tax=Nicrophorus vespilloides TaxID=110193 RepID=A0ABM1M0T0_NICVS|nr:PREDICTED: uncharacterized protein LOC108556538 [Nicrophorus vespilloides]
MMCSKIVLVFAALIAFQAVSARPRDSQSELQRAVEDFRNATIDAIREGNTKMINLLKELAVSSRETEKQAYQKIEAKVEAAISQVNLEEEQALAEGLNVEDCIIIARDSLNALVGLLSNDVQNCGWNARQQSQTMVNDISNTIGWEFNHKNQAYIASWDLCLSKEDSNPCLRDLITLVKADTKNYPVEIGQRIGQIISAIGLVESGMFQCIDRANIAANQAQSIVSQIYSCLYIHNQQ